MKNLVELIAKSLVDHPDQVLVSQKSDAEGDVIVLQVTADDMGKVIGKQGRIAKALRTVVKAAATKDERKVNVDIISDVEAAAQAASEAAQTAVETAAAE